MQLIALDFETYYDQDYSLRKLTTEHYVRDDRFMTHCVALNTGGESRVLDNYQFVQFCRAADWSQLAVIFWHAHFDAFVLNWHYWRRPALILDGMAMSQLLMPTGSHSLHGVAQALGIPVVQKVGLADAKGKRVLDEPTRQALYADCARDAQLTWQVFHKLLPHFPREELGVIDLTVRMFSEPALVLDRPRMEKFNRDVTARKQAFLDSLGVTREDLQSAEKFAALLRQCGVEPPTKPSPTGNGEIYAFAKTDPDMGVLTEHDDYRVQSLASARLGVKSTLDETRSQRLLDMAGRGPLPVYLKYCGAHTTRWSGGDSINWQNFPRESIDADGNRAPGEIRSAILAPEAYKLAVADLSQIECRIVNWLAGQEDVIQRFREGRDPYTPVASLYYGREITKADKEERQLGKVIELACGFGMGGSTFQRSARNKGVALSPADAQRGVETYRNSHAQVVALWKYANFVVDALARKDAPFQWGPMTVDRGIIWLPNGAPLHYREMEQRMVPGFNGGPPRPQWYVKVGREWRKLYGAKLVENVVQALARVVISQAMLRISRKLKIAISEHDAVACLARADDSEALPFLLAELRRVPEWAPGLPLDAEGSEGVNYAKG